MQGLQQLQKEEPSSVREAGQSRGSRAGAPEETGTGSRTRLERGSQRGQASPRHTPHRTGRGHKR